MRIRPQFIALTAVAAIGFVGVQPIKSQSFASSASANTAVSAPIKSHVDAAPDKFISAHVRGGLLTVDGMVAKVHLNYDIKNQAYLYFFLPGSGTAVVSLSKLHDGTYEKGAIHGSTLTITAGNHTFELTCEGKFLEADAEKSGVYVRFDPETTALDHFPMMGFGNNTEAPYQWPGSRSESKSDLNEAHVVAPPPVPVNLLPKTQPAKKAVPAPAPAPVVAVTTAENQ